LLPCSEKEAHNRAVVLEMIGDLPEADAKPPPNMLFICKLNPVTTEEDLEIIFSRFGTITSCDIIRYVCRLLQMFQNHACSRQ
jgi:peptidyl-prolyl cis-trans isomerase-like 4